MQPISVLAKATEADIRPEPFPHLSITDALPAAYFAALSARFPDPAEIARNDGPPGHNTLHSASAAAVLADAGPPPIWRDFVRHHCSRDFFADVLRVWGTTIRLLYPGLEAAWGKPLADLSLAIRAPGREQNPLNLRAHVSMDCQLAVNTPPRAASSVRGVHVDHPCKLYTALLYMRASDDGSTGGDLELMRYRDPQLRPEPGRPVDFAFVRRTPFRELGDLPPDAADPVAAIPYRANTLVMWINSPHTLHRVTPRAVTPHYRRYVNIIAECFPPGFPGFFQSSNEGSEIGRRILAELQRRA